MDAVGHVCVKWASPQSLAFELDCIDAPFFDPASPKPALFPFIASNPLLWVPIQGSRHLVIMSPSR